MNPGPLSALTPTDNPMPEHRSGVAGRGVQTTYRIILADDHPVVLLGVKMALTLPIGSPFSVVAEAYNADELLQQLERYPCEILVCDYSMPDSQSPDGLKLMSYVKRHFSHVKLIVMTMLCNPGLLQALLNTGVNGLFDKHSSLTELKQAVHAVAKGRRYLSPSFERMLDAQTLPRHADEAPKAALSERELEVVRLFVQGMSGRQIAAQLNRSEKTISRQKRTAMDKLGVGHGGALVEFARVSGLKG
ncbi:response regulator transcription factor [Pseudomonas sp. TNT3]|uniref:response regulator transcription factor n=1 Tax=Pseudomonas sp. TNT3 TaxID=2654097 RepID=UPI0013907423|nr:response regulator transcription factor [Pseudomonas sp. TNT3]KAI2693179.1 response regulator transcription factor [Pseudomonas sp. TNT3]